MPCSACERTLRRTLLVCLALVANLIAAGTPLLHAAAHDLHGDHHDVLASVATLQGADHGHDEVHAPSLHDDAVLVKQAAPDFLFVAPALPVSLELSGPERTVAFHPVPRLPSRAPPPGDPARAPPLA